MTKVALVDRIVALIAQRPGIRNIEISEEVDIDAWVVQPVIVGRIKNSQIIVDKVRDGGGRLINAYRINPKWTLADGNFVPAPRIDTTDDGSPDGLPMRQVIVPAGEKPVATTPLRLSRAPATSTPKPKMTPAPLAQSQAAVATHTTAQATPLIEKEAVMQTTPPVPVFAELTDTAGLPLAAKPGLAAPEAEIVPPARIDEPNPSPALAVPVPDPFLCSFHHDGRGEIRTAAGHLELNEAQVAIIAQHFTLAGQVKRAMALAAKPS